MLDLNTGNLKGGTQCHHRVLNRSLSDQPVGDNGLPFGLNRSGYEILSLDDRVLVEPRPIVLSSPLKPGFER